MKKDPKWYLETENWGIRDIYRAIMQVLANACINNTETQRALFQEIWVILSLCANTLGVPPSHRGVSGC
jgi:hypothetical protein